MLAFMVDDWTWATVGDRLEGLPRGSKNKLAIELELDPSDMGRRIERSRRRKTFAPGKDSSAEPTAAQARTIEAFFQRRGSQAADDMPPPPAPTPRQAPVEASRRIPVYGYAAAGDEDRVAMASNQVLDYVDVPVGLVRGEAFIVRTVGESMYPRLRSGEPVLVERGVPPVRNDDVLVELADGTGLVKEYRGQRDGYLLLFQYNPERELKIPLTQVRKIHSASPWRRR